MPNEFLSFRAVTFMRSRAKNYPGGVDLNCRNVRSDSIKEEALPRPLAADASWPKAN